MCGICGIFTPNEPPSIPVLQRMMAALSHRGPDGSGHYVEESIALGHTRLAIIDTANGAQPMCNEDGRVWVTFNGEIFNYVELTSQLRDRGHRFRTRCDTEVIVHAWEEWGPGCFERFNGQWAMAIWDGRSHELVLSRDRFGVRPLFYTWCQGRLLFGSEVKALFADPAVSREFDPVGLDQVFTFWSTVAPRTAFRGVLQVPPGSYVVIQGRQDTLHRYWEPSFPAAGEEPYQDLTENVEALRERVVEATRVRFLRSDVPVGAYLSGGIDSAITAASIMAFTDAPLETFSVRFTDGEFDEGAFQHLMSERLGTAHHEVVVGPRDIAEVFPDVVWHAETPLLRSAPAPMLLLSRLVQENGYKVVVTGEGADEVLAGYDIFREALVRQFWSRNRQSSSRSRAVELLYPWMRRSPNSAPGFAKTFFGRNLEPADPAFSHRPRWESTAVLKSMLAPGLVDAEGPRADAQLLSLLPPTSPDWDLLARAQYLEMTTLLPGYILASQGDRMLMASSVEGRFPFLDVNVAALASGLPARQKMLGLSEKHLLKMAFAELVPEEIRYRPKQPYRAPDAASFFVGGGPDWLEAATSPESVRAVGVFREPMVERLLAKCRASSGRGMSNTDNMRLLAVISVQLLHQMLIQGEVTRAPSPPQPHAVVEYPVGG